MLAGAAAVWNCCCCCVDVGAEVLAAAADWRGREAGQAASVGGLLLELLGNEGELRLSAVAAGCCAAAVAAV